MEDVGFEYKLGHPVLSNINVEIKSGSGLVCIIGPNGVGKSTLIKCINKLITPTSGRVLLDGIDIAEMTQKEVAQYIGFVQTVSTSLFAMTVFEAVLQGRYNKSKWKTDKKDLHLVDRVLKVMGVSDLSESYITELSAGQFQKVMLARGLVQETEILLLDEPTSNLDVRAQIFVASLMKKIAKTENKTIIMISHDINIAAKFADKIIMLVPPGEIYGTGAPEELITREGIRKAYGIDCDIVTHEGHPSILLRGDSV